MGSPHKKSVEEILADEKFHFPAYAIKPLFVSEAAWKDFVTRFLKLREEKRSFVHFGGKPPTPDNLKLFYDFNEGKIDYKDLRKAWGFNVSATLGKIFAWVSQQQRKKGDNGKSHNTGSQSGALKGKTTQKGNGR